MEICKKAVAFGLNDWTKGITLMDRKDKKKTQVVF